MSASIYYQPVQGKLLNVGAPSSFMSALREAFHGDPPWTFTDRDYHTLMGLSAGLSSTDQKQAATELADAALKHGEIRVWPEY